MVAPKLGEVVLDPECGSGGFLTDAHKPMKHRVETTEDQALLKGSVRGVEQKPLPHLLCVTNMMVHGVAVPSHIHRDNTLIRPLRDYGPADQVRCASPRG
jgi:type I restriction enzyme M protein